MRNLFKRVLAVAAATVLTFTMSSSAFAAEDIVLDDSGSPFIKTFDPGDAGDYKYMGYVYCFEAPSEYKYLQITYTGDATAFEELRLEFVVNSDPAEEIKLTPCWFSENDEGTFKTTDGGLVPAPSSKEQTVTIDLAASGIDLSTGIRAFHVHDTPGKGTFTITDARLLTEVPGGSKAVADTNTKTDSKSSDDKKTDSKSSKSDSSKSAEAPAEDAGSGSGSQAGATTGGGSTAAPATGSATLPIAVALGGIAVAAVAFVGSRKMKED
ncbi:MAG: hypothetical protein E7254_01275 [Lachnospiraceae bacterium]|nr:hypothetical protein [Lachnospiraceae bacterium]